FGLRDIKHRFALKIGPEVEAAEGEGKAFGKRGREGRLAGAGESADCDKKGCGGVEILKRSLKIAARSINRRVPLIPRYLAGEIGVHHRPDPGAEREKERERFQPVNVRFRARKIKIAVEQAHGDLRHVPMMKIHQKEGEIIKRVDGRKLLIKLERIEKYRAP